MYIRVPLTCYNCLCGCAGIVAFCLWFYISGIIERCEVSERCCVNGYEVIRNMSGNSIDRKSV